MGLPILEETLRTLRAAGFTADVAFPGQKYPPITQTVAAVHIAQVDRANMTVTVEITVISPADLGGTVCETQALLATEALRNAGARCVQKGCAYDGMAQVYCVDIQAVYTGIAEENSSTLGPGFAVYVDGIKLEYITDFSVEEVRDLAVYHAVGENEPAGSWPGKRCWEITMVEWIPAGSTETVYPLLAAKITLEKSETRGEIYYDFRFTSLKQEYSSGGMKRTWKGTALKKAVTASG